MTSDSVPCSTRKRNSVPGLLWVKDALVEIACLYTDDSGWGCNFTYAIKKSLALIICVVYIVHLTGRMNILAGNFEWVDDV